LAGFFTVGLETRWQQFYENLNFLCENLIFLHENLGFSVRKILMIFSMIFLMIHKISCYKVRVSTGVVETRWVGDSFE